VACEVWKQLADPDSSLAVLRELEWRTQQCTELIAIAAYGLSSERFSGVGAELWLGVKQVDVAWTTPHEEKDDTLGASW
jgi:hypothetical protein